MPVASGRSSMPECSSSGSDTSYPIIPQPMDAIDSPRAARRPKRDEPTKLRRLVDFITIWAPARHEAARTFSCGWGPSGSLRHAQLVRCWLAAEGWAAWELQKLPEASRFLRRQD